MQMKVNFDQLFSFSSLQSKSNFKSKIHLSQASTSLGFQQINKIKTAKEESSKIKIQNKIDDFAMKTKTTAAMRILQVNQQSVQKYNWYAATKFNSQQPKQQSKIKINKKQKELNKKQAQQLIERLHKNDSCNKACCKKVKQNAFIEKIDKNIKQINIPLPQKRHKRTLTETSKNKNINSQKSICLHERLYLDYKERQFRNMQRSLEYEQEKSKRNQMRLYQNPQYNQKYVKFYERLQYEIERKNKKQQFYQNYIIDEGKILQFAPNIRTSQSSLHLALKKPTLMPKRQTNQIKGKAQMNEIRRLNSSLDNINRSFQSSLNKTIEIVHGKEQQFLTKIIRLFEQDGYFKVKHQSIQLLKQVQFQILFPLINKMQKEQNVPIQVFEAKLYKYFQNLPNTFKITLRNSQKSRLKHKMKIKQAQTINIPNILKESFKSKTHKNNTKNGDYLRKIQNYV